MKQRIEVILQLARNEQLTRGVLTATLPSDPNFDYARGRWESASQSLGDMGIAMVSIIKEMQEREKKLVEALKWYTDSDNFFDYIESDKFGGILIEDKIYHKAREALKEVE